jgi:solute carrier family 25 (mitochondrial oxoglutarate transporter), member 11
MEHYKNKSEDGTTSFLQKAGAAVFAGSFGSFWGNPFDLVLVQMQADSTLPKAARRNYRHFGDAFM